MKLKTHQQLMINPTDKQMNNKTNSKIGPYIMAVIIGFIWWGVYAILGMFDIPMWVYKSALAFVCVYIPFSVLVIAVNWKEFSNTNNDDTKKKIPTMKVYGKSSRE